MLDAQVLPDSIAGRADTLPPAFVCSCRRGSGRCLGACRRRAGHRHASATGAGACDAGACGARRAWLYATVLAVGCVLSRVVAKSGSRDRSTEDG